MSYLHILFSIELYIHLSLSHFPIEMVKLKNLYPLNTNFGTKIQNMIGWCISFSILIDSSYTASPNSFVNYFILFHKF